LFHIDNLEESGILPANVVYSLSDLYGESFEEFKAGWRYIESQKRLRAIQTLAELCETNYDLGYELLAYLGFEDEMPEIRAASVDLVWFDASEKLFHRLMALAEDHSPIVRAAAISGLGRFIYEAEVAHFNGQLAEMARDFVVERYYDYLEDVQVRRSALEAASQGSHPAVPDMILEAYQSPEHEMRVSALFAMGASCDTERWRDIVMQELDSQYPDMRFQAARAAGELVLEEAVIKLFELANEPDYEIKTQAIISLGDIGSNEAKRSLNALAERATQEGDNDLLEVIEEAIEYSSFMGGLLLPMFDFDEDNE
ncbi:MAG: hypothetical protein CUN55_16120, partial [Phototrophicales bacterium]